MTMTGQRRYVLAACAIVVIVGGVLDILASSAAAEVDREAKRVEKPNRIDSDRPDGPNTKANARSAHTRLALFVPFRCGTAATDGAGFPAAAAAAAAPGL